MPLLIRPDRFILVRSILGGNEHSAGATDRALSRARKKIGAGRGGANAHWFRTRASPSPESPGHAERCFTPPHGLRWRVFWWSTQEEVAESHQERVAEEGSSETVAFSGPVFAARFEEGVLLDLCGVVVNQGDEPITIVHVAAVCGDVTYKELESRVLPDPATPWVWPDRCLSQARLRGRDSIRFRGLWGRAGQRSLGLDADAGLVILSLADGSIVQGEFRVEESDATLPKP